MHTFFLFIRHFLVLYFLPSLSNQLANLNLIRFALVLLSY